MRELSISDGLNRDIPVLAALMETPAAREIAAQTVEKLLTHRRAVVAEVSRLEAAGAVEAGRHAQLVDAATKKLETARKAFEAARDAFHLAENAKLSHSISADIEVTCLRNELRLTADPRLDAYEAALRDAAADLIGGSGNKIRFVTRRRVDPMFPPEREETNLDTDGMVANLDALRIGRERIDALRYQALANDELDAELAKVRELTRIRPVEADEVPWYMRPARAIAGLFRRGA